MAKEVRLNERDRVSIIMFSERHEGTRTEIKRMDRALDVIDQDNVSDKIEAVGMGLSISDGIDKLSEEDEGFIFEDEPFKTLKTFLQNLTIPYSRRKDHVGRVLMSAMDKFDKAKDAKIGKKRDK